MNKFDIKDRLDKALYSLYNALSEMIFQTSFEAKKILKGNSVFEGRHSKERCFIFGNGPSLNGLTNGDIEKLKNETVIAVNSFYKSDLAEIIHPKYYALVDDLYFRKWSDTFDKVKKRFHKKPPVFIADYRAKKSIDALEKDNDAIYIYSKKYATTKMSENIKENIYAPMNVVSVSILAAMYMGFKEIYLLGCDYNAFCTQGKGHFYDDKEETSELSYDLAFYLKYYWITTEFHYLIFKLAKKKGIKVINLTEGSLLDAYPRKSIGETLA